MSYLAETTARLIGVRRTVQARAILTLTKHLVEGSQHRYQRLGPQQYMQEYDQVRLAIVHPTVARSLFENTDEPNKPEPLLQGEYATGGVVHMHEQGHAYGLNTARGYNNGQANTQ